MKKRGHGEGSIYQRSSDGRWVGCLRMSDGTRKYVYAKTRAAVQKKLTSRLADLDRGVSLPSDERLTLGKYLSKWLEDTCKPTVRFSTLKGYESKIRVHILPSLGSVALSKLTPQRLEAFFNQKVSSGLSPRTVQHLRGILRNALNDALKWNLVGRNAASLVNGPRVPSSEIEPLTPEEARKMLHAAHDHRLGAVFSVALAVGLRQGEALGLRWQDVDFDKGQITVNVALQRVGKEFMLVEPKTKRSRRTIALPNVTCNALKVHRSRQLEERLAAGPIWEERGLVFTTPLGTPLHGTNVTRSFQELLAKAGIRKQRFHDLRHACASILHAQGVDIGTIMRILGHTNISQTMNTYTHIFAEPQLDAAKRMDSALGA